MGRGKWKICKALMFFLILGAMILLTVKQIQQEEEYKAQIGKMEQQLAALGESGAEQQKNLARWYNYNLDLGTQGLSAAYDNILNFGNGIMAALEVPELNILLPVFHGEKGLAGHLAQSHFPIGGRAKHTVLMLKAWYPWKNGMAVYIDCLNKRIVYRVESVQVMSAGWPEEWPSEQDRLTMITDCGGLRTLVRCVRCGELNVRKAEERIYFAAAVLICSIWICGKLLKKCKHAGVCRRKYHGFSHKNRRKSKLL